MWDERIKNHRTWLKRHPYPNLSAEDSHRRFRYIKRISNVQVKLSFSYRNIQKLKDYILMIRTCINVVVGIEKEQYPNRVDLDQFEDDRRLEIEQLLKKMRAKKCKSISSNKNNDKRIEIRRQKENKLSYGHKAVLIWDLTVLGKVMNQDVVSGVFYNYQPDALDAERRIVIQKISDKGYHHALGFMQEIKARRAKELRENKNHVGGLNNHKLK
jgi:hypothetical protein